MADVGKVRRGSKEGNFEFEEHQLWDYNSVSSNVSNGSGPNPKQVYNNISSSSLSAPMSIPDWQKIYGTPQVINNEEFFKNNNNEDADEDERIPPHEYIASSQISSFSVCEGAGRTLKGRDLSRVRNAILTKTGFLD